MRNLTVTNQQIEQFERATIPGMAHWSGTGPAGATCGGCRFWGYFDVDGSKRYSAKCEKFYLMTGKHGRETIEGNTRACKYFEKRKMRGEK